MLESRENIPRNVDGDLEPSLTKQQCETSEWN
jgi:hypothetical protein